jgi:DNA-binding FadR family transcriptional regulator
VAKSSSVRASSTVSTDVGAGGRARASTLASAIARRIEGEIAAAGWPVGRVLGSESDLCTRYGVSRAVLREAIRLVEHHGVGHMRRGPSGGLVVRAPEARPLTAAMVIHLEYVGTTVEDLLAVRLLLEPLAVRLAAEHITEEGIETLRSVLEEERAQTTEHTPLGSNLLHVSLARLSGNPVLDLLIDVLVQLTERYAKLPAQRNEAASSVRADSERAHEKLVDAVVAGNASLAESRMVKHLTAMRDWMLSTRQRPIGRSPGFLTMGLNGKHKLAEITARRIIADIIRSRAKDGEVVGSETQLLQRYDVSRAVLREAARLLEYHSVARMRRGPGGGLVVSTPDVSASVQAAAVYLDYRGVALDDLKAVRNILELGGLELLMARQDAPEVANRLAERHQVRSDTPLTVIDELSRMLHRAIAELSGNPVLELFVALLTEVWARHHHSPVDVSAADGETAAHVARVHDRIVEAVAAGDLPLARHRMHRHLETLDAWWE